MCDVTSLTKQTNSWQAISSFIYIYSLLAGQYWEFCFSYSVDFSNKRYIPWDLLAVLQCPLRFPFYCLLCLDFTLLRREYYATWKRASVLDVVDKILANGGHHLFDVSQSIDRVAQEVGNADGSDSVYAHRLYIHYTQQPPNLSSNSRWPIMQTRIPYFERELIFLFYHRCRHHFTVMGKRFRVRK